MNHLEHTSIDALSVDTHKLNAVLNKIASALHRHAGLLDRIPEIEQHQVQLKKDLHLFQLNASSLESLESAGIGIGNGSTSRSHEHTQEFHSLAKDTNENDTNENENDNEHKDIEETKESSFSSASPSAAVIPAETKNEPSSRDRPRGVTSRRLRAVNDAVQKVGNEINKSTISELRKDIVGIKAIVTHLQQELNFEIVHSSETDQRVDSIQTTLTHLENEDGPGGATAAALQRQREFMLNKVESLLQTIHEVETSTKAVVDRKMNAKLLEMKSWFSSLESTIKSRQAQLQSKMAMFANNSEVAALEENINNEIKDYRSRVEVLETSVISNEDSLRTMRQHASIVSFQKFVRNWRIRVFGHAWNKWKAYNDLIVERDQKAVQRRKNMRKALIRSWFARKSTAWKKWQEFTLYQKKVELMKDCAIRRVIEKMQLTVSEPSRLAFNKWRRMTVALKIQEHKIVDYNRDDGDIYGDGSSLRVRIPRETTSSEDAGAGVDPYLDLDSHTYLPADSNANQYDLSTLLNSFNEDKDGAIQTLAQEINNIKIFDIRRARRDMDSRIEETESRFDESLTAAVTELHKRSNEIEEKFDDKYESMALQLPKMKNEIAEMRNSLHGTINRVKVIEHTHRDRIELLFEGKEAMEEEILTFKSDLSNTLSRLDSLEHNNNRSQTTINTLLQNMNNFQSFYKDHKESTDLQIVQLKDTLSTVTQDLIKSNKNADQLNKDLIETRNSLIQSKVSSEAAFKDVHGMLDSHGISQPKDCDIIEHGGIFEEKSKEKKYVVPINFAVNDRFGLDIPANIAAFAQDYAAWIAFEADREALKHVIIGKNPEDTSVDDNTEILRKHLLKR